MVMHVLGGTVRGKAKDTIRGTFGIADDGGLSMRAEEAPGGCAVFEISVLENLAFAAAGIFDDAEIVQQNFAGIEQAEDEFVPASGAAIGSSGGGITVGLPFARAAA